MPLLYYILLIACFAPAFFPLLKPILTNDREPSLTITLDVIMACPWQLYLFSLLNIGAGIVCCFTELVCEWGFGQCSHPIESLLVRVFAICMLYVGVLVATLTYIGHRGCCCNTNNNSEYELTDEYIAGEKAKLKRLSMIATQCTVATLVGIMMIGPVDKGGIETNWAHWADMATFAVLFIIMWTAIADDKQVAGLSSNLCSGLGVNPKTLLWIYLIGGTIKLFLITDVMSYHYLLDMNPDPDATAAADGDSDSESELARVLWNFMAIFVLEIVLVIFYAIGYGNYKDQEATVAAVTIMSIVSGCIVWGNEFYSNKLMTQWIIVVVVAIVLALGAIVGGRKSRNPRNGYAEVGDV